jgi:hypothetical protein
MAERVNDPSLKHKMLELALVGASPCSWPAVGRKRCENRAPRQSEAGDGAPADEPA